MGFGWQSSHASGMGSDTITSGFEGAWTANPTQWDNGYFDILFGYEWEKVETPAGKIVWHAVDQERRGQGTRRRKPFCSCTNHDDNSRYVNARRSCLSRDLKTFS